MDARELTRDEKKKIRTLVTGMCANYDRESGLCFPLDCACYMLHNMIDGVPNNTPIPPTPPELDAKPLDKVKEPKERRKGRELER